MSASEPGFALPIDFAARCAAVNADIEAGVPMSLGRIAEEIGMPFEVLAAYVAAYCQVVFGSEIYIGGECQTAPN